MIARRWWCTCGREGCRFTRSRPRAACAMTARAGSSRGLNAMATCCANGSLDDDRYLRVAAHGAGVQPHGLVVVDLPAREALERLLQRDPPFETRQRGTNAVVDAVAEGHVVVEGTAHVEPVRVGIHPLVTAGRTGQQEHLGISGDHGAVEFDVSCRPASLYGGRRLE